MKQEYCNNCRKITGHKRALGWGTFFGGLFTLGFSLLCIPFYPKRCIICGMDLSGTRRLNKSDNSRFFAEISNVESKEEEISEENQTKKCPFCAEIIKLEAIKCRFCGEKFNPVDVAEQIAKFKKEGVLENKVLCSDGNCIGVIGSDGRCKVCGKPYEPNIEPDIIQVKAVLQKPFYKKWWLLLLIGLGILFIIQSFFGGFVGSDNLSEPEKRLQKFNKMSSAEHLTEAKTIKGELDLIQKGKNTFSVLNVLIEKIYQLRRHLEAIKQGEKEFVEAQSLIEQIAPLEAQIKAILEKIAKEKTKAIANAKEKITSKLKYKNIWTLKNFSYKNGELICGYSSVTPKAIAIWWAKDSNIYNVNGAAMANTSKFKTMKSTVWGYSAEYQKHAAASEAYDFCARQTESSPTTGKQVNDELTKKMVAIDMNIFPQSLYKEHLDYIYEKCPNYTNEQIADMSAYAYTELKKKGVDDSLFITLKGIKESIPKKGCKEFKLEEIIAAYVIIRKNQ